MHEVITYEDSKDRIGMEIIYHEPSIPDLKFRHINMLGKFLDHSYRNNRNVLGKRIFQNDGQATGKIDFLKHHYKEQESPSWKFVQALMERKENFTVDEFKLVAIQLKRNDIAIYMESLNHPSPALLLNLTYEQREKLTRFLEKRIHNDWRMFADATGFTNNEIVTFKNNIERDYRYSPTESLINMIKHEHPILSLSQLMGVCSEIDRNDVGEYLQTVIEEIRTERSSTDIRC